MASTNTQVQAAVENLRNLGMSQVQIDELARTRQRANTVTVRSPADGFIVTRNVSPGQRFDQGDELYVIADLRRVWIVADVFQDEARFIKPGMPVRVHVPGQDRQFDARVGRILPQFDAVTRTMKVRIETENPGYQLRPDMFVDVELNVSLPETLTVPSAALVDSGRRKVVYVAHGDGHFEPRQVETGLAVRRPRAGHGGPDGRRAHRRVGQLPDRLREPDEGRRAGAAGRDREGRDLRHGRGGASGAGEGARERVRGPDLLLLRRDVQAGVRRRARQARREIARRDRPRRGPMIDRIIDFSVNNKIVVLLLVGAAALAGAISLRSVPLDAIPDLSDTQVIVYSRWDRSPDLVEAQVTYPIVSAMVGAPHVRAVRGFSDFGYSFVYVIFEDGTDIYWARSRTLEYLSGVLATLPPDAKTQLGPDATGLGWVYQYALVDTSGTHSLADIRSYQDWYLRYYLKSVPGVAEVATIGGFGRQYQVNLDPNRLRDYGITTQRVVEAVRGGNSETGGRLIEFGGTEYMVRGRATRRRSPTSSGSSWP